MTLLARRRIWFTVSFIMILPGLISLVIWQLNLGIDFKGGSLVEYRVEAQSQTGSENLPVRQQGSELIKKLYIEEAVGEPIIHTDTINQDFRYLVKSQSIDPAKRSNIVRRLSESTPKLQELSFESIDPQVGGDVTRKAIWAVIVASIVIIGYITLSFRGIPKPSSSLQFGVFAVIALLHDVMFIIGFFSLMGHFYGWEVNSEFVTATLTVMGFSVHDTIVVFDRLRENLKHNPSHSFKATANKSITQTIVRSLNTSLTVVLVLLAVVLLGGTNIRVFATTLLVGITVGTYSSIFVATTLLDWWQDVSKSRLVSTRFRFKTVRAVFDSRN